MGKSKVTRQILSIFVQLISRKMAKIQTSCLDGVFFRLLKYSIHSKSSLPSGWLAIGSPKEVV
jgi:hypothetical protein